MELLDLLLFLTGRWEIEERQYGVVVKKLASVLERSRFKSCFSYTLATLHTHHWNTATLGNSQFLSVPGTINCWSVVEGTSSLVVPYTNEITGIENTDSCLTLFFFFKNGNSIPFNKHLLSIYSVQGVGRHKGNSCFQEATFYREIQNHKRQMQETTNKLGGGEKVG